MTREEIAQEFLYFVVRRIGEHSPLHNAYGFVQDIVEDPATGELKVLVVWERSAPELNENNTQVYSVKFMRSKGIQVLPNMLLKNNKRLNELVRLENQRKDVEKSVQSVPQQQELDMDDTVEPTKETVKEEPRLFLVLETDSLSPMSVEKAKELLKEQTKKNPGKTYTLAYMTHHARYPINPIIVKA